MRKRYSRSYTVLSFLTMFSYREQPLRAFFFYASFVHTMGKATSSCSCGVEGIKNSRAGLWPFLGGLGEGPCRHLPVFSLNILGTDFFIPWNFRRPS